MKEIEEIVQILTKRRETIATMESCTGGALASFFTDIEGSSLILHFSAVTYQNEFKIKMGVDSQIIDQYTVYSKEVAHEMSNHICSFAHSTYGIGITGKLNRKDPANPYGNDSTVYYSIYDHKNCKYIEKKLVVSASSRRENKEQVILDIAQTFLNYLRKLENERII